MKHWGWIIAIFLCFASLSFANHVCGTSIVMQNFLNNKNKTFSQHRLSKPIARESTTACTADDLYDSVYTRTTKHFDIFYTLEGPHKTTTAYIDSLEKALEYAWDFHVNKSGMLPPKGYFESYHYEMPTHSEHYPVEVIDMTLLRNYQNFLDGAPCYLCFGLTLPMDGDESVLLTLYIPQNSFRLKTPRTLTAKIALTFVLQKNS